MPPQRIVVRQGRHWDRSCITYGPVGRLLWPSGLIFVPTYVLLACPPVGALLVVPAVPVLRWALGDVLRSSARRVSLWADQR